MNHDSAPDGASCHVAAPLELAEERLRVGQLEAAAQVCREVLQAHPDHPEALYLLGLVAQRAARPDEAAELLGLAVALHPGPPARFHAALGTALRASGELDEAVESYREATDLCPDDPMLRRELGAALQERGDLAAAIAQYRQAVELDPECPETWIALARALAQCSDAAGAVVAYTQAAEAQRRRWALGAALACCQEALRLRPDDPSLHNTLGIILCWMGRSAEALAHLRRTVELRPDWPTPHSMLLLISHYVACDREALAAEARTWARRHAVPLASTARPHLNDPDPDRRLRVGYVSAAFGHSAGYTLEAVLPFHDPARVEAYCYASSRLEQKPSAALGVSADHWRAVADLGDEQFADLVRSDRIDILIDMTGHTGGGRLLAFARRPSPVQVSWQGYSDTTGLEQIDYLLADARVCPPEDEHLYAERIVRLPDCYLCYAPRPFAPPVAPAPATACGYVTFGSFNFLPKLSSETVAAWAAILTAVPDARLLLKTPALDDAQTREHCLARFAEYGVGPGRLRLVGRMRQDELLSLYAEVDLALDPFPYNGTVTTLEALWQGVPLLSVVGDRFVGRVSLSLLAALRLAEELVARDERGYVERAAALARDPARLAALRAELRPRMAGSALCDGRRFARHLEAALCSMWRAWCIARRFARHLEAALCSMWRAWCIARRPE